MIGLAQTTEALGVLAGQDAVIQRLEVDALAKLPLQVLIPVDATVDVVGWAGTELQKTGLCPHPSRSSRTVSSSRQTRRSSQSAARSAYGAYLGAKHSALLLRHVDERQPFDAFETYQMPPHNILLALRLFKEYRGNLVRFALRSRPGTNQSLISFRNAEEPNVWLKWLNDPLVMLQSRLAIQIHPVDELHFKFQCRVQNEHAYNSSV